MINDFKKEIGKLIYIIGLAILLLSIVNMFNTTKHIKNFNNCIENSFYDPSTSMDDCKDIVNNSLNISIMNDKLNLTFGQYIKVYLIDVILLLFSLLIMTIGKYLYVVKEVVKKYGKPKITKKKGISRKKVVKKKKNTKKKK